MSIEDSDVDSSFQKTPRKPGNPTSCQSPRAPECGGIPPASNEDGSFIPTIDLENPHQSLVGRVIESLGKRGKLDLGALKHADALDATTRENAEFFLECVEESADLNQLGRLMVESMVREILRTHHLVDRITRRETFAPIRNPVFILGLPRTGSSYLFNLLGATRCFRTLGHWETHQVGSPSPVFLKRLATASMLKLMHHLSPGFRTVHEIRLDGPEECTKLLMARFVCQSFPAIFHIPRYNRFLDDADYLPTYEFYHKQLQVLGSQQKRWLLKSPIHLQSIDSLLEIFPDARFIHLHRDFEESACSVCSLAAAYRCMTSHRVNGREIGSEVRKYLERDLEKGREILRSIPESVLDIDCREISAQPVGTVRRIFDFVGSRYTDEVEQAVRREMQISIPNKYGRHLYRHEDYFPAGDEPAV